MQSKPLIPAILITLGIRITIFILILSLTKSPVNGQCIPPQQLFDSISIVGNELSWSADQKLSHLYYWKNKFAVCKLPADTVLAWLEFFIAKNEALRKKNSLSLQHNLRALEINNTSKKDYSKSLAENCFSAIAHDYDKLMLFSQALSYYDSAIHMAENNNDQKNLGLDARLFKSYIFFRSGDYQKGIEESTMGISRALLKKDSLFYLRFLNQRAQSYFFQAQIENALKDIEIAIKLSERLGQVTQLASAYKMLGYILTRKRNFNGAKTAFNRSVEIRKQTKDYGQVAGDYSDFGNFYRDSVHKYEIAKRTYANALIYANKAIDSVRLSRIYVNLGKTYFLESNYDNASLCYTKAFMYLKLADKDDSITDTPSIKQISLNGNKELIIAALQTKVELLLALYRETENNIYLDACIENSLITDLAITQMRHEQAGEKSKLYWRDRTRKFFSNALEACVEARNPILALRFMEKSRAVLLSDKLNELTASSYLPQDSLVIEQNLTTKVIEQQQILNSLKEGSSEYSKQYNSYLEQKAARDNFIKSLEQNYPLYYQYKYDDSVPGLKDVQHYLSNDQSLIYYFISDTAVYMLCISASDIKMIKQPVRNYNDTVHSFLQRCSDASTLNRSYGDYAKEANGIYKILFEKLNIQKERVIICPDNFLIPFEALCTDTIGKEFLAYNHAFSYVYSANILMKKSINSSGKGNFLGFAPVHFGGTRLTTLNGSDVYLKSSSSFYSRTKLLTDKNATKSNFISMVPYYQIVNVFSHATANSNNEEPMLFTSDSSLRLSELQRIFNPATRLVVLSACETSAGKNATGEGIYSLARGFAAAGIPSVAATLWKADDQSIYQITEKFHEHVAKGIPLDKALDLAKQSYMKNSQGKSLPYFWANMIVVGKTEPVVLSKNDHIVLWIIITSTVFLSAAAFIMVKRKQSKAA